jgi:hypothetical protein
VVVSPNWPGVSVMSGRARSGRAARIFLSAFWIASTSGPEDLGTMWAPSDDRQELSLTRTAGD